MNIFVGNLSFDAKEADVYKLFMPFGGVSFVEIVMDKNGKKSRGFGFLEMTDDKGAYAAIAALDGREFMGRPLNVESARPKSGQVQSDIKIKKDSAYKQGRRSRSFMKRRAAAGIEQPIPERKFHDNPMRWRKKPKPWQKSTSAAKPWEESKGPSKPWIKAEGGPKPWKKSEGEPKPWRTSIEHPQQRRFKSRKKPGGYKR